MEFRELTRAEEQIMQMLWDLKKAFVKEIVDELSEPKPAYDTVSTIVRILETILSFFIRVIQLQWVRELFVTDEIVQVKQILHLVLLNDIQIGSVSNQRLTTVKIGFSNSEPQHLKSKEEYLSKKKHLRDNTVQLLNLRWGMEDNAANRKHFGDIAAKDKIGSSYIKVNEET